MVAAIEHHQCGIEFTPCGVDKRLDKVAETYTLIDNRAMGYRIMKQTYAIAVGGVNASQIVAVVGGVADDSFWSGFQFGGVEKVLQERVPIS